MAGEHLRSHPGGVTAEDFKARSIDLYITSFCNRRCSYCFLTDEFLLSRQNMALGTVDDIIKWAVKGTIEEVTLLGGEPALHPDFDQIALAISLAGLRLRTVTNGSPRFQRMLRTRPGVAAAFSRVAVSLDAPTAEQFDALRGRYAFRDALATINQLGELGMAFDINFTVLKSTVGSVRDMLGFAEELGARRINMHWFSLVGRGAEHARDEVVPAAQWREVLSIAQGYRPRRSGFLIDCELGFGYGLPGEDAGMCAVRDMSNLQFMPDGTVFSCGMLIDRPELAGYSWQGGVLSRRSAETELTIAEPECAGCPVRTAREAPGPDDPRPLCIYNRLVRT